MVDIKLQLFEVNDFILCGCFSLKRDLNTFSNLLYFYSNLLRSRKFNCISSLIRRIFFLPCSYFLYTRFYNISLGNHSVMQVEFRISGAWKEYFGLKSFSTVQGKVGFVLQRERERNIRAGQGDVQFTEYKWEYRIRFPCLSLFLQHYFAISVIPRIT